jgi:hypothetical protein
MSKRYDAVLSSKDKNDKTRYTKVGVMFVNDEGKMSLRFDPGVSVSTPDGVWLNLFEPKPKEDGDSRF